MKTPPRSRRPKATAGTAPIINSIIFDQASYAPGATITATVTYTPGTSPLVQTLTGTATDSASGQTGTLAVSFTVNKNDPTAVMVADSGNRTWTKVSDTGAVAKFTATA